MTIILYEERKIPTVRSKSGLFFIRALTKTIKLDNFTKHEQKMNNDIED